MNHSLRQRFALFLLCWLSTVGFAPDAFAEKKKPSPLTDDEAVRPTVVLSPFEVKARSLTFEHWVKISSPHFVIYTDAGTKEATTILQHLEMVHVVAQSFFRRTSLNLAPVIIVLPTSRSDWGKIASRGEVEWQVATSLVSNSSDVMLVQYDWQSDGLESVLAMLGAHEVTAMNLSGPLWFKRGIGRFFETVTFGKDTMNVGKQSLYTIHLKNNGWMNWERFFSITGGSPEFTRDTRAHDQYEGQCAVFVHYLLTNADPASLPRLLGWASYLEAGNAPTAESFKEVFGQDWTSLQAQIDKMLDGGTYTSHNIKFPPAVLNFEIAPGVPAAVEMRELFVLSQILNRDTKDSATSLDAILEHGLKTESLRPLLADACYRRGRKAPALTEFRAIIAAGTTNPKVYSRAGELLFRQTVHEPSLDARFPDETGEVQLWCSKALALEPHDVTASETLAWAEALAPKVEKPNLETIVGICRTLDQNADTDEALMALAVARSRSGGLKQARSLCDKLITSPFSRKPVKKLATALLAQLDAVPAAAPAASEIK